MNSIRDQIRQLNQDSVDIPSQWLDRLRFYDSGPSSPDSEPEVIFAGPATDELPEIGEASQSLPAPITYVTDIEPDPTTDPDELAEIENHLKIPFATEPIDTSQTHEIHDDEILAEMRLLESIIDEELWETTVADTDSAESDDSGGAIEDEDFDNPDTPPAPLEQSTSADLPIDPNQILTPAIGMEYDATQDVLTPVLDGEEEICEAVVSDLADRAKKNQAPPEEAPDSLFQSIEESIESLSVESAKIDDVIEEEEHQQVDLIEEFDTGALTILESFETDDVQTEADSTAIASLEMTKQFNYAKNKHRKRIDAIAEKIVERFAPGNSTTIMLVNLGPESNIDAASVNLATSLAIGTDAEILLIDANMPCRDISRGLGIESAAGIAEIINRNDDIASLICRSDHPNLHVLAAGNGQITNRKLDVDRVLHLTNAIKPEFAYSIICGGQVDDLIVGALAPLVDGIYLMIDMQQSDRDFAQQAIDHLRRIGARVVGVIASQL